MRSFSPVNNSTTDNQLLRWLHWGIHGFHMLNSNMAVPTSIFILYLCFFSFFFNTSTEFVPEAKLLQIWHLDYLVGVQAN